MNRRAFLLASGALCVEAAMSRHVKAARKPNIVVILADDLGYADLGCQGCKDIPTPNIDSIAANGVRFTNGYSTHPVCSPSRAGLMAGCYQHRFGFEHNSGPKRYAAANFGVPRSQPILPERLKALGYATGMAGKWHIGFKEGLRPHERGFDYHYGFLSGAHGYMPGVEDRNPIIRNGVTVTDEKEYLTDAFARESVNFIERSKDGPFFLYLAFNAVHSPLEATAKYQDRFKEITDNKRKVYAGMLSAMDDAVGRVLAKLREHNLEENTLIFFYSDNGGPTPQTTSRNDPLRGYKAQMYEGGVRVPFMVQWKGVLPAGKVYEEMVMGFDVHATALIAAGGAIPTDMPFDGVDLIPYLTGKVQGAPHDRFFWRSGGTYAARVGDWKLVQERDGGVQLFNLKDDIGESNDLAKKNPEKLKELAAAFDAWAEQMMEPQWIRQDATNAEPGGKLLDQPRRGPGRRGGGGRIQQAIQNADKDGDGKLSQAEYPQPDLFDAIDKDKNGFATMDEIRAYYTNRRAAGGSEQ